MTTPTNMTTNPGATPHVPSLRLSGRRDSLRAWQPRGRPDTDGGLVTATLPGLGAPVTFQPPAGSGLRCSI